MAAVSPIAEPKEEVGIKSTAKPQKQGFTLKPSRQTCIALAALIGVTLVSSGSLYAWQSKDLSDLDVLVQGEQGKIESDEKIEARRSRTQLEFDGEQNKIKFLETTVSQKEYIPTLLKQMESLGKSVNLTVDSIRPALEESPVKKPEVKDPAKTADTPAPPAPKAGQREWPYDKEHVDMQVRGSYWNVAKLLYRLNEFPKILAVEGITMQPSDAKGSAEPQLNVQLKLTGFIFPNDGKPNPASVVAGTVPNTAQTTTMADGKSVPVPPTGIPGSGAADRVHAQQNQVMNDR